MKRLITILLVLIFLPVISMAASKKHPPVQVEQACSECHEAEAVTWQEHKHGLMGVGCVVCHGDLEKNFLKRPGPERCTGCHAEQVSGRAAGHKTKPKSCWTCHNGHTLLTNQGR
ncbi:MAG TPA: hypothetical protein VMB78_02655 [Dissulfurispiraceae bacterium]|nr:hypothetical protein [Dissulfurispiraceae bacterium]